MIQDGDYDLEKPEPWKGESWHNASLRILSELKALMEEAAKPLPVGVTVHPEWHQGAAHEARCAYEIVREMIFDMEYEWEKGKEITSPE